MSHVMLYYFYSGGLRCSIILTSVNPSDKAFSMPRNRTNHLCHTGVAEWTGAWLLMMINSNRIVDRYNLVLRKPTYCLLPTLQNWTYIHKQKWETLVTMSKCYLRCIHVSTSRVWRFFPTLLLSGGHVTLTYVIIGFIGFCITFLITCLNIRHFEYRSG